MNGEDNWQDVLRAQQDEMRRLEMMNEALDEGTGQLDADINKALKKTSTKIASSRPVSGKKRGGSAVMIGSPPRGRDLVESLHEEAPDLPDIQVDRGNQDLPEPAPPTSPEIDPKAPDTAAKFAKARIRVLEKQVHDGKQLRQQLLDQVHDIQKQLKNERDENKKLKKRVQLLEVDQKRSARVGDGPTNSSAGPSVSDLQAEVASLRKDLQTAERLAKQAESHNKSKDLQLKRSTEAISRLRAENEELVTQAQAGSHGDKAKLDEMTTRVKSLEKQRVDLIDAFKKQMKLIDVLKRQKSHIEAARLLSFSEEEFLKTLDWAL